jgi:hypothetical protein
MGDRDADGDGSREGFECSRITCRAKRQPGGGARRREEEHSQMTRKARRPRQDATRRRQMLRDHCAAAPSNDASAALRFESVSAARPSPCRPALRRASPQPQDDPRSCNRTRSAGGRGRKREGKTHMRKTRSMRAQLNCSLGSSVQSHCRISARRQEAPAPLSKRGAGAGAAEAAGESDAAAAAAAGAVAGADALAAPAEDIEEDVERQEGAAQGREARRKAAPRGAPQRPSHVACTLPAR